MFKKIDHIGVAVKNLDEAVELYKKLGFEVKEIEEVAEQKVKVAMLPVAREAGRAAEEGGRSGGSRAAC